MNMTCLTSNPSRRHGRREQAVAAFTLVELLTVLAIVGVLSAVVFSLVRRANVSAKRAQSASNLRQLGMAFTQYAAEHKGAFPIAAQKTQNIHRTWDLELYPYLGGTREGAARILRDPADATERQPATSASRSFSMVRAAGFGVAAGVSYTDAAPAVRRLIEIPSPSRTLLLVTRSAPANVAYGDSCTVADVASDQLTYGSDMYDGRFNYLFCDGHVEFLRPAETIGDGTMSVPKGMWRL
ncbi:MAG: prepilin-type N-terminal cleavage/methylation domain-containing protein [Rariglobus sp.]